MAHLIGGPPTELHHARGRQPDNLPGEDADVLELPVEDDERLDRE
ncbi:MAG TPA: hypothetical protein VFW06_08855 [Acidimicrobiia bacterium]|nr:hypothetical protein [Acidimicrobiia bacterium]